MYSNCISQFLFVSFNDFARDNSPLLIRASSDKSVKRKKILDTREINFSTSGHNGNSFVQAIAILEAQEARELAMEFGLLGHAYRANLL